MIIMHAVLLYGQFMTFMLPYIAIYDLVIISCFLYGGQPGKALLLLLTCQAVLLLDAFLK